MSFTVNLVAIVHLNQQIIGLLPRECQSHSQVVTWKLIPSQLAIQMERVVNAAKYTRSKPTSLLDGT